MKRQILANIKTNLKFYARNALLWFLIIIFFFYGGITIFFSTIYSSETLKFRNIQTIVSLLIQYCFIIISILGMLTLFSHIRNRSLKLVFTKPCSPENWFLSLYLSIFLVGGVCFFLILIISYLLFLVWKIPFQTGIFYILIYNFVMACIYSFFLCFLTIFLHPLLSIFFALAFNENSFYEILIFIRAAIKNVTNPSYLFWLKVSEKLLHFIYMVLPASFFKEEKFKITQRWIATGKDFAHLGIVVLYGFVISSLFYFLSCYLIKKKRII